MPELKLLPQDLDAEKTLLSACFIRPEIITELQNILSPADLYLEKHQDIFKAMLSLGNGTDIITLKDRLETCGKLEAVGGIGYLAELQDVVSTSVGWRRYAAIIKEKSQRRDIIHACQIALDQAHHEPLTETLTKLQDGIHAVQQSEAPAHINNTSVLQDVVDHAGSKEPPKGIRTGFQNLDQWLGTIEPGTTCYLAARPSIGKTALALAIMDNVIDKSQQSTEILFSLEMTGEAIMRRRLSRASGVFMSKLKYGNVGASQWPDIIQAATALSMDQPIIVEDARFKRVERMSAYSRAISTKGPVSLILIDHIQKMSSVRKSQSRHHELSYVSERLCDVAKDLKCPVIVLCQLRRNQEGRPRLEDMKESGDLEANADVVLGLYRVDKKSEIMEVECLKNRDGAAGWKEYLRFDPATQNFSDEKKPEGETAQEKVL